MEFVSRTAQLGQPASDYSLLGGKDLDRGRRLYLSGLTVLGAALIYLSYTAKVEELLHLVQGNIIIILAVLPSLFWAKSGGSRFPAFEPIMLLCANAYGLPMLNANEQLAGYPAEVITHAGWSVIIYQAIGIITYLKIGGTPGRSRFWTEAIISHQIERLIVYGMITSTIYIWLSTFTNVIPRELNSALRAVFYGISILCTFVCSQRWGRGEMTSHEKAVLTITLSIQLVLMSMSLVLIAALGLIGIALLGYLSGSKRVPWILLITLFAIVAVLHNGKSKMRVKYWEEFAPPPTSITQTYSFYSEWISYGLQKSDQEKNMSRHLLERSSLMHILCLIVAYSPDRQDYLYGKTYSYVLPQLIPRVLWPEKPRSHIATYELAVYYGLQSEEATESTTIAFGLVAEAYANFGMFGTAMLGFFWGFILKKLQIWSTYSPMFSFAGLLMILITAWSFSAELTMAAWLSSLEQAMLVVLVVPMTIRSLFGL
jgi:hypothetical protein